MKLLVILSFFLSSILLVGCVSPPIGNQKQQATEVQKYKRSYFSGWTDEDGNCLDTRSEVLKDRSAIAVNYKKVRGSECRVLTGQWNDFYYNEVLTDATLVDIDHIVPLKHAWQSGASEWDQKKRDRFATDPENLVITNRSYNRLKGAKTILQWMPVDKAYACRYVLQWFTIKKKYGLLISTEEIGYRDHLACGQ